MAIENASFDIGNEYVAHREAVMRFLVGFGVNAFEAEDITQDAFLRVMNLPSGTKRPDNFFGWLLTCTRNLAINRWRKSQREILAVRETWQRFESTVPAAVSPADDRLHHKRLMLAVRRALQVGLSPIERDCLVLRSSGSTYREIAAKLEITLDRAIYVTGRAIDKIHNELQELV